jgi:hypothetical protein
LKVEFEGAVKCERSRGAVNLLLHTRNVDVLFSGAEALELPATLHQVCVTQVEPSVGTDCCFRIESAEVNTQLRARGAQIHRDAAVPMFAAVPPRAVPLHVRAGWTVLLSVLRLPGLGRLIVRPRGDS